MSNEKIPVGPPPPYTPNNMSQSRSELQTQSPYACPSTPHSVLGWVQSPGFSSQPPAGPGMESYGQPTIQSQSHQLYKYQAQQPQPPYQAHQQWPHTPTAPLWPTAISQPQPTAYPNMHSHQLSPLPPPPPLIPPPPITTNYPPLEYPYIPTAKRQMTVLSPDRTQPLFTVVYPSGWSTTPKLTIRRGSSPDGPEVGGAHFHSLTTDKVDAFLVAPGGGRFDYHFRKKFRSHTGLTLPTVGDGAKMMKWAIEDGAMVLLSEEGGRGGGYVARFVASDLGGEKGGVKDATKRLEGRLEIWRAGLTALQFEEVFVTLVAEMERKRRDNEDWEILEAIWKHSSGSGDDWGGLF